MTKDYQNINLMAEIFLNCKNPNIEKLKSLDDIDFMALIFSLYTGMYEILGINNKHFLVQFMISKGEENIPAEIVNTLKYSKNDFLEVVNFQLLKK